jgi:hypothetical protein
MPCANQCGDSEIKYKGNGSQVLFDFPFQYIDQDDVKVDLFDEDTRRWVSVDDPLWEAFSWTFANPTTIEFNIAPAAPTLPTTDANIRIYRCTPIDPMIAQFNPGSAIRARDLNDNFEQLQRAIQENRCQVPDWLFDYLDKYYWNKQNETIYTNDEFICDDQHVATGGAICKKIEDAIDDRIVTDPDFCPGSDTEIPSTGAICERLDGYVETLDIITRAQQTTGPQPTIAEQRLGDDTVFSSSASAARHDTYHQDATPAHPQNYAEQPGKNWWDTNVLGDYTWDDNAGAWIDIGMAGPPGIAGPVGPPGVIHTGDNPPTKYDDPYFNGERDIRNGDAWWNTSNAHLYVYYAPDPGGSNQWVDTSVPGPQGRPGIPVTVHTGDEPPTQFPTDNGFRPVEDGDLWWDTSNANLYVYYSPDPGGSSQWVDIGKPGPQGPQGPAGQSGGTINYTFQAPLNVDANDKVTFDISNLSTL